MPYSLAALPTADNPDNVLWAAWPKGYPESAKLRSAPSAAMVHQLMSKAKCSGGAIWDSFMDVLPNAIKAVKSVPGVSALANAVGSLPVLNNVTKEVKKMMHSGGPYEAVMGRQHQELQTAIKAFTKQIENIFAEYNKEAAEIQSQLETGRQGYQQPIDTPPPPSPFTSPDITPSPGNDSTEITNGKRPRLHWD